MLVLAHKRPIPFDGGRARPFALFACTVAAAADDLDARDPRPGQHGGADVPRRHSGNGQGRRSDTNIRPESHARGVPQAYPGGPGRAGRRHKSRRCQPRRRPLGAGAAPYPSHTLAPLGQPRAADPVGPEPSARPPQPVACGGGIGGAGSARQPAEPLRRRTSAVPRGVPQAYPGDAKCELSVTGLATDLRSKLVQKSATAIVKMVSNFPVSGRASWRLVGPVCSGPSPLAVLTMLLVPE